MKTQIVTLLKSPLSGYWLIQGANMKMIELAVKTKKAALRRAKDKGFEYVRSVNDEVINLRQIDTNYPTIEDYKNYNKSLLK